MVRDFSEEKKEELYKALEVIDIKEWKPFMTWCGGRAGEFGVWADRLGISSYTRRIDDYQEWILNTNNSTRNQIDTIFENVAEVDRRYVGIFRGYVENVREQMLHVQTMTQVMCAVNRSKKDGDNGIPLKDAVDILSAEVSIEEFEQKLQCYGKGNDVTYENLCEYLDLLLSGHYLTRSEYVAMKGYISNLGHVPSSEENTIRENISKLLSNLASIDEKIEAAKRNMSLDNPRAIVEYRLLNEYRNDLLDGTMTLDEIEEIIDIMEKKNPKLFTNIGVLYIYSPSECNNLVTNVVKEYETLTTYVNEVVLEELDWNIREAKSNLGNDFLVVLRREMLKNGITSEMNVKCFLVTISVETGHGSRLLEDDYGDETYFEGREKYTINTRGAGLIHVTGASQFNFLEHLIKNTSDENEIANLEKLRDGYTDLDGKCDNLVLINDMNAAEYIAKYYPIDSAIWFWSVNGFCLMDNKSVTLSEFIDGHEASDKEVLLLASQYYVNGRKYTMETIEEMCNNGSSGLVHSRINEKGETIWEVNYLGTIKPAPNGWSERSEYFHILEGIEK